MDKCGSLWFQRFVAGCRNRMGVVWKPNLALSTPLLLQVLRDAEESLYDASDDKMKNNWLVFVTYVVVSYVLSLRGNEGLVLDLRAMHQNWKRNDGTYFLVALKGKSRVTFASTTVIH